jgi:hypothetical protein
VKIGRAAITYPPVEVLRLGPNEDPEFEQAATMTALDHAQLVLYLTGRWRERQDEARVGDEAHIRDYAAAVERQGSWLTPGRFYAG